MQTIGRFEVIRPLGRGGHSTVVLARDPNLDRRVAIKLMRLSGKATDHRGRLLHEARTVGALRHPHIVPIYEAGEHAGAPYLVFEHVAGQTLAQLLKRSTGLAPQRAAKLMLGILDALTHAHAAGVVHRDLKPSNVLVTADDQARVMDFGIASRIDPPGSVGEGLVGTPAYMAPEYVSRGEIGPQNDIFAAGLLFYEMLFGQSAIQGAGVFQLLHRVANEPLVFPGDAHARIGDPLIDVIAKATAKEPVLRYASAAQMKQAIDRYLRPEETAAAAGSGSSTLDFLLLRMRHKSDFPAMSAAISTINRLAVSERSDAAALSNAILKDFALTNKILRLANSAYYRGPGRDRVSTVSRATVMLGFDTVRNLAISLMLFEHIGDRRHADVLQDQFLTASLRGLTARALCADSAAELGEQAFICGMFHSLGRMLANYYFREEAEMIDRLVTSGECGEEAAAARVLGLGYEALGIGVAQSWGFPDTLVHSMRRVPASRVARPGSEEEQLRLIVGCADELTAALLLPEGQRKSAQSATLARFGAALGIDVQLVRQANGEATERLRELAQALNIPVQSGAFAGLLNGAVETPTEVPAGLSPLVANGREPETAPAHDAEAVLVAGIQDISQSLIEDTPSANVLQIIAEIVYRALKPRRVVICLHDGSGTMRARHGFGEDLEQAMAVLRFKLGGSDLFNLILARDVDVLISDARADKVRQRLPDWFSTRFDARALIVMPLRLNRAPVAMIYADSPEPDGVRVSPAALAALRTLRNQALLAIKQRN